MSSSLVFAVLILCFGTGSLQFDLTDSSLLGLWALTSETYVNEIGHGIPPTNVDYPKLDPGAGPFGKAETSYGVVCNNCRMADFDGMFVPNNSTFTVSFYLKSKLDHAGTIVAFSQVGGDNKFRVEFLYPNLLSFTGVVGGGIVRFPVLKSDVWNFISVTYNPNDGFIVAHKPNGDMFPYAKMAVKLPNIDPAKARFSLGGDYNSNGLKTGDQLACVMVHTKELSKSEIAQLPDLCKSVQPQ